MIIGYDKSRINCPVCGDRMHWVQTLLVAYRECAACKHKDKPIDVPAIPVLSLVNKIRSKFRREIL